MTAGAFAGTAPWPAPERARRIAAVLWIILGLNWAVAVLKLFIGHFTQSTAIFADGLHSFSDGASNIIGLVGISMAAAPADHDHPYGHQKYETFAAIAIGFLLIFVALRIYVEAAQSFVRAAVPQVGFLSFAVVGGTFVINLFVVLYERGKARELQSDLLKADSWHTLTDVFVTLSVLVALVGIRLGIPRLDAVFAFLIGTVIVVTAVGILKASSDVLCDKAPIEPDVIERVVRGIEGVSDCHEIRTRGRLDAIYVDLHALVDEKMTVLESHRLANRIEHEIKARVVGVFDVVVHIEPLSHEHEEV